MVHLFSAVRVCTYTCCPRKATGFSCDGQYFAY